MKRSTKVNLALAGLSFGVTSVVTYFSTRVLRTMGYEKMLKNQLSSGTMSLSFAKQLLDEQNREDIVLSVVAGATAGIGSFVLLQSAKAVRKAI